MSAKDPPRIRWLVEPTFDDDGVQRSAGIDSMGREHGDPIPMAPPVGLSVNRSGDELHGIIKKMFITERERWRMAIEAEQFESEAEANDFLTEDEVFPPGTEPWEELFEFPGDPGGSGQQLASEAANGNGGQQNPPPQPVSQKVSEGSSSESLSSPKTVGKQTDAGSRDQKVP